MTDIAKFITDAKKAFKFNRQNSNGSLDCTKLENELNRLFKNASKAPDGITNSIFYQWNTAFQTEQNEELLYKLGGYLAFLNNSDEYQEYITDSDWQELGELVNFEAEDLPINILQDLMKILVSKGAY